MPHFGFTHTLTIITLALIAVLCIRFGRRGSRWPQAFLAFLCLATYPFNQLAFTTLDFNVPLDNTLPFHLCDVAAFTAGFALLTQKPLLAELTYCWGLTGTLQALITPDLPFNFPHPIFWSFFIQHGVVVITALYFPLALGWKPRPGVFPRVILWSEGYFCAALLINFLLDTNFGFLSQKPQTATLLDHFGDWPVYLIGIQILAALLMLLLLLPFRSSINIWRSPQSRLKTPHE